MLVTLSASNVEDEVQLTLFQFYKDCYIHVDGFYSEIH
jgi:hypothetical protein